MISIFSETLEVGSNKAPTPKEAPKRKHQDGIGDEEFLTKDASCTSNVNDTHGIIESTPEEASNMRNPYDIPGKESATKEIPSRSLQNHTKKTASKPQRFCLLRDIDQDNGKQVSMRVILEVTTETVMKSVMEMCRNIHQTCCGRRT